MGIFIGFDEVRVVTCNGVVSVAGLWSFVKGGSVGLLDLVDVSDGGCGCTSIRVLGLLGEYKDKIRDHDGEMKRLGRVHLNSGIVYSSLIQRLPP